MPTLTLTQRVAKLEAENLELKLMLGFKFLGLTSEQLAAELKPENTLRGERYPYILSDYQLRATAIDPLFAEDGILVKIRQDIERVEHETASRFTEMAELIVATATDPDDPAPIPLPDPPAVGQGGVPSDDTPQQTNVVLPIRSREGAAIRFVTDTDGLQPQRREQESPQHPGRNFEQYFTVEASEDGGGGFSQNVVWPGGGKRGFIPDPSRPGYQWRMERYGGMALNEYIADPNDEFEPGKFGIKWQRKGQIGVFYIIPSGIVLRLPQYEGKFFVEMGWGGHPEHEKGNEEVRSTHEVLLGPDVGYQR